MANTFDKLKQRISSTADSARDLAKEAYDESIKIYERANKSRIVIGVTGLSRAGKSAFITSFISQLKHIDSARLAGFGAAVSGRITRVEIVNSGDFEPFDYVDARNMLSSESPTWPPSTTNISSCELVIYYLHSKGKPARKLNVQIIDYPGEYLYDLTMLNQNYKQWSESWFLMQRSTGRKIIAQNFIDTQQRDAPEAEQYRAFVAALAGLRDAGYSQISPGQLLLQSESFGDREKLFLPYKGNDIERLERYERTYERYKNIELKNFVSNVFLKQDRQIVLVDLLSALNRGEEHFLDQKEALELIVNNTKFGKQSSIINAFNPKVSKVVFACTKSDNALSGEHDNLRDLLLAVVKPIYEAAAITGVSPICEAIASIRSSVEQEYNGQKLLVAKVLESGERYGFANPTILSRVPGPEEWSEYQAWNLHRLRPPSVNKEHALPHIRIDSILNHLLEDLL